MSQGVKPISVAIIDDHPWMRLGIGALLGADADFMVCGEAESGVDALSLVAEHRPDIAVVDISLKGTMDGIELTGALKDLHPNLAVLVLSMHSEPQYARKALASGASGYMSKEDASTSLLNALRSIQQGGIYLSGAMRDALG